MIKSKLKAKNCNRFTRKPAAISLLLFSITRHQSRLSRRAPFIRALCVLNKPRWYKWSVLHLMSSAGYISAEKNNKKNLTYSKFDFKTCKNLFRNLSFQKYFKVFKSINIRCYARARIADFGTHFKLIRHLYLYSTVSPRSTVSHESTN